MSVILSAQSSGAIYISDDGFRGFSATASKSAFVPNYLKKASAYKVHLFSSPSERRRGSKGKVLTFQTKVHPRFALKGPKAKNYKPWRHRVKTTSKSK